MKSACCRLTPAQNRRLNQITVYIQKLLKDEKSPKEIAMEEGVSEDEVRKAFSEILELTGNKIAMDQVNEAIARFDAKEE